MVSCTFFWIILIEVQDNILVNWVRLYWDMNLLMQPQSINTFCFKSQFYACVVFFVVKFSYALYFVSQLLLYNICSLLTLWFHTWRIYEYLFVQNAVIECALFIYHLFVHFFLYVLSIYISFVLLISVYKVPSEIVASVC